MVMSLSAIKNISAKIIELLPGLLILVLSMLGLHAAIVLMQNHDALEAFYVIHNHEFHDSKVETPEARSFQNFSQKMRDSENRLYWMVFLLGLTGFVLVILNTEKLGRLRRRDRDLQNNLKVLKENLAAMESSYDGIGIVDHEGKLKYMNRAMRELHGFSEDQLESYIGQEWINLYDPETQDMFESEIMPVLAEGNRWIGERKMITCQGHEMDIEVTITRMPDGGMIGIARNLEEKRLGDREREELQEQFFQAQKMEAVGRLAGGVAHDFNNILAAINGYAEFLEEDLEKDTPQHKFASNILQAGRQARSLIEQMLAFSRRKESGMEVIDLTYILKDVSGMMTASLPQSIDFSIENELEAVHINGNPVQIQQILMNLCVNARDAMSKDVGSLTITLDRVESHTYSDLGLLKDELPVTRGQPPIRIESLAKDHTRLFLNTLKKDQSYIRLKVTDTGEGMSRSVMEHIFEPFFTTKPVDKGTGLGLSTVHGVVTSHQAAMILDSRVKHGTSFEILFPADEALITADDPDTQEVPEDMRDEGHLILVVEDKDNVRDVTVTVLERMGYQVESCESAVVALEILRENAGAFDLVVTDHSMPKMTGAELAMQMQEEDPDLPFIVVSGYSEKKLQDIDKSCPGIKTVLRKPASRSDLHAAIKEALGDKKSRQAA